MASACRAWVRLSTPSMPARPVERSSPVTRGCNSRDAGSAADQVPGRACGRDAGLATTNDGETYELRSGSRKTQEGLGRKFSLEGHQARLHRRRSRPAARFGTYRAHAGTARFGKALEARQRATVRQFARAADRQPGEAAGQARPE